MTADTSTTLDIEQLVAPFEENDDPNHRAHYVRRADNEHLADTGAITAQELIDVARMMGVEVVALCGHRWVPKANPTKHEVCAKCVDIGVDLKMGRRT